MSRSLWRGVRTAFFGVSYADRLGSISGPTLVDLRATVASPAAFRAPMSGEEVAYYRLELGVRIDESSTLPPALVQPSLFRFDLLSERTSTSDLVVRTEDDVSIRFGAGELVVVARHPRGGHLIESLPDDLDLGKIYQGLSVLDAPAYRETSLKPGDRVTFTAVVRPPSVRGQSAYRAGASDDVFTVEPEAVPIVLEKLST